MIAFRKKGSRIVTAKEMKLPRLARVLLHKEMQCPYMGDEDLMNILRVLSFEDVRVSSQT